MKFRMLPCLAALLALLMAAPVLAAQKTREELDVIHFCYSFSSIEWMSFYGTIKEMEAPPYSAYSVEEYFMAPACQMNKTSTNVKSPILHCIAEGTVMREKFLPILWEYYTKKRHAPEKFAEVVNAKNTQGETLLDYIETLSRDGRSYNDLLKEAADRIVAFACAHGGVYSKYKDKKCP